MSSTLDEICARHGIALRWNGVCYQADLLNQNVVGGISDKAVGKTRDDAVCALLKARWGMVTTWGVVTNDEPEFRWAAWPADDEQTWTSGPTELAAVVALADRLAATREGA